MENKEHIQSLLEKSLGDSVIVDVQVLQFNSNSNGHEIVTSVKVNDKHNGYLFTTIEIPDVAIGFGFNAKDGFTNVYRYTLNEYLKAELKRCGIEEEVVMIVELVCDACG